MTTVRSDPSTASPPSGSPTTATPTPRPPRRRSGVTIAVVVLAGVLVVVAALSLLDSATRGQSTSPGRSSTLSTAPGGLEAYATLLAQYGYHVQPRRGSLASISLAASTDGLFVVDGPELDHAEVAAIANFVDSGGRLVVAGDAPWLADVVSDPPVWVPTAPAASTVRLEGRTFTVRTDGDGSWIVGDRRALVTRVAVGRGAVVLVADSSPLQNHRLAEADNAAFGVGLAGPTGTRLAFAEGVHGYGSATGLGGIPDRWKYALVAGALAALLLVIAGGRRIGPAEDEARALAPPRSSYIDAMAEALARTRDPARALAPLQTEVRRRAASRFGLRASDTADDALVAAATRHGWPPEDAAALVRLPTDDGTVLALGRALSRTATSGADATSPTVASGVDPLGRAAGSGADAIRGTPRRPGASEIPREGTQ